MPTKDDLAEELRQVKEELAQALQDVDKAKKETEDVRKESEKKGDVKPKKTVFVTKDRKLPKFDGTGDLEDWMEEIQLYCDTHEIDETKCAELMLEQLSGLAKDEVRCRVTAGVSLNTIQGVLREAFGETLTIGQLWGKFHSTKQQKENILEFSIKLMKLISRIAKLDRTTSIKRDQLLKSRFTEGLRDEHLRRDAVRLDLDHPEWDFYTLRKRVMQLAGSECSAMGNAVKAEVEQNVVSEKQKDEVLELLRKQQDTLSDMGSRLKKLEFSDKPSGKVFKKKNWKQKQGKGHKEPSKHVNDKGERLCFKCDQPGHVLARCPLKKTSTNNTEAQVEQPKESL